MSEQFKVGEVATIQNAVFDLWLNGQDCTVVRGLHRIQDSRTGEIFIGYSVELPNGKPLGCHPHQLKKRKPPTTGEDAVMGMFKSRYREREIA